MKCKVCQVEVQKIPEPRGTSTRFVDELGRLWNGRVCPDCYKTYNRERMKKSRAAKKTESPDQELDIQDT